MIKYYTRACNFYYGPNSRELVEKKLSLPLNGNKNISFDQIEILTRKSRKKIHISQIRKLNLKLKEKIFLDIKKITNQKKFKKLNFNNSPLIMGILNVTPDSFSDGGKFYKTYNAINQTKKLINNGCDIIDIGGESTRPGSRSLSPKKEWLRVKDVIKKINKFKKFVSIDTRNEYVMNKSSYFNVNLINDISGLTHDPKTLEFLKKKKISFVINHIQGNPQNMQNKPFYKNILLDVYDYFEDKISAIRSLGIKHNNIILDPGIGFGKNLKHNITLIRDVSIFHSLGFPLLLGISRKRFIKDISGSNDSKERLGGTISTYLHLMMNDVQIMRVHDVNELKQSIKVFKKLYY